MENGGFSITLSQFVQVAGSILALAISYATVRISRLHYAGSPPVGILKSWRRLEESERNEKMRITIHFWNHRKYALEIFSLQIVVPSKNFLRLTPEPEGRHGFDTLPKRVDELVVPPNEHKAMEFESPYQLNPEGMGPYPFAVVIGYLDPRVGKYKKMWVYSEFYKPSYIRRLRNRFVDRVFFPFLTAKIKICAIARILK